VPLGAFLSGGVDSSLIVAMMQEHTTTPVRTFTVRFRDSEFDESAHAAAVARHLGTDHVEETCDEADMLGIVDKLPEIFDEPHADSSVIPTYLVSRAARRHVTVALSGDGGDELFWGYPRYRYHSSAKAALLLPLPLRRAAAAVAAHLPTRRLRRISDVLANEDSDTYASFVTLFGQRDVEALTGAISPDAPMYQQARRRSTELDPATMPSLVDFVTYLPDDILVKVDRASMALGLEVRSPLLDQHVVEFALGLPMAFKQRGGETKWLLKQLLYKRVPRRLVDRPKQGFGVPLRAWLLGPLRAQMDDYCRSGDLFAAGINPEAAREIWRQFTSGAYRRPDLLWQLFVLAAWTRHYLIPSGRVELSLPCDTN
jgi:asparagine synthase (glutamine-hydrolysing)